MAASSWKFSHPLGMEDGVNRSYSEWQNSKKRNCLFTLVMGPAELGLREACPETELFGLSVFCVDVLGLNEVILCDTPGASVNCSRSSTLVRPLAKKGAKKLGLVSYSSVIAEFIGKMGKNFLRISFIF